ncbi:MAG: nitrile hydratase accessory protein [Hyphomicrobiaceae bacterium]
MTASRGDVPACPAPVRSDRLPEIPGIGQPEGAQVFAEPWEARIFAIVVEMNRQGRFPWADFNAVFVEEVQRNERERLGRAYYLNWAIAAERLIERLGLLERTEVDAVVAALRPDDRTVRLR